MPQATLLYGNPVMVDYTPGSAVAAGDVIITSGTARIAHLDIAANALGALAASGGIYTVNGNAVIAADVKVYWVDADDEVTATAGTNKVFGVTVTACAGDGLPCTVRHDPSA